MASMSQKRIAQLAGVDPSAVSHALRGTGTLSQETRQRILAICAEHHYHPNAHARSLRTADSRLIGVLTGQLNHSFHALLIHELTAALAAHDYHLMLRYCAFNAPPEHRRDQLLGLLDRQAAGVIVATYWADLQEEIHHLVQAGIPLVMAGFATGQAPSVSCDRFNAGRRVARHLVEQGCRHLVTLMDPARNIEDTRDKKHGFIQGLADAGYTGRVTHHPVNVYQNPFHVGQEAGRQMMAWPALPDGVFCDSDDLAIGLMRTLLDHGVRIPEQVAIVGFDDTPNAGCASVPLSSVHQPLASIASQSVDILLKQIQAESSTSANDVQEDQETDQAIGLGGKRQTLIPCQLIVRASSSPPGLIQTDS